jgi:hypothetical protein
MKQYSRQIATIIFTILLMISGCGKEYEDPTLVGTWEFSQVIKVRGTLWGTQCTVIDSVQSSGQICFNADGTGWFESEVFLETLLDTGFLWSDYYEGDPDAITLIFKGIESYGKMYFESRDSGTFMFKYQGSGGGLGAQPYYYCIDLERVR